MSNKWNRCPTSGARSDYEARCPSGNALLGNLKSPQPPWQQIVGLKAVPKVVSEISSSYVGRVNFRHYTFVHILLFRSGMATELLCAAMGQIADRTARAGADGTYVTW